VSDGGTVENEVGGMQDTEVCRPRLVLPLLGEDAADLLPLDDGTGTAWTRVACQVNCSAGLREGVSVVEGDIATRQHEGEVDVAIGGAIGAGPLQEIGEVGDSVGMAKRHSDMGIG